MTTHHGAALFIVGAVVGLVAGCGSRPQDVQTTPVATLLPARADTIVLLPDEGASTAGRLVVRGGAGEVSLDEPWASTRVHATGSPQAVTPLAEDGRSRVHEALAGLPLAPVTFTLHFTLESEKLTAESLSRLNDVGAAATGRPAVEVLVSGHTDRSGATDANVALGLSRAASIRDLLVKSGVPAAAIRITSHGEATPIVPTRDGAFEPRNRRVEITVR